MLFQNTVLTLLASASVVLAVAFPGGDKDKTTCSAVYKTDSWVDYNKSIYTITETKTYATTGFATKESTTSVPYSYTTTVYKSTTKPYFITNLKTEKYPVTIYTTKTNTNVETKYETKIDKETSVGTGYKISTVTITVPHASTKTEYKTITKETKVPTTKYKTETKTACTTKGGY